MSFIDLFRPVTTWSAEEVRDFLELHSPEEYQLVDVRQQAEYARGHLPGARWIPMDRLDESLEALDRDRPVITY